MIPLDFGRYILLDGMIYRRVGAAGAVRRGDVVISAVDPAVEPRRREIPQERVRFVEISPSATLRGHRVDALTFDQDGTVLFRSWEHPREWPADVVLQRYGMPERASDGFWTGTVPASELTDIDDGIPHDWRPFLPPGDVRGR